MQDVTYDVQRTDNTTTLFRISKDGLSKSEIARVIDTRKNRVLIIKSYIIKSYRFKDNIKFKKIGSQYVAVVTDVRVFKLPHHTEYHIEVMRQNRTRYFLSTATQAVELDYDGILDNMLDYITTI